MKGIVFYEERSYNKNVFFANRLLTTLKALGHEMKLVLFGQKFETPDFVVMRSFDVDLSKKLESNGVRVFNNSKVAEICNDKLLTYQYFKKTGVPHAPTFIADKDCPLSYPYIIKSRFGHGGSEVFMVRNDCEREEAVGLIDNRGIAQPITGKKGRDLRVYVMGGEPVTAMLRKSDSDFRANFSLGGYAERYDLSYAEIALVKKVICGLSADFVGVDFLLGENGLICNEIEDAVGCRMIYSLTDIDIIKNYAEYIDGVLRRQNA